MTDAPEDPLDLELIAILRKTRGNVIEAIKHCREKTGLGLKDAKDRVDGLREKAGLPPPLGPTAERITSILGCLGLILFAVLAGSIVYRWFIK